MIKTQYKTMSGGPDAGSPKAGCPKAGCPLEKGRDSSDSSPTGPDRGRRAGRHGLFLLALGAFLFATMMGTGPGVYLVNDRTQTVLLFGIPILYVWVVFWFVMMVLSIIGIAMTYSVEDTDPDSDRNGQRESKDAMGEGEKK